MPRNSSGTMTLPSPGVPFQSGTTISTTQMNATLADVATEVSDSLSRSGKGPMTMPLRLPDGSMAIPSLAFTGEQASGFYRAGTNDVRFTVGGVDALKLVSGAVSTPIVNPPLTLMTAGQPSIAFISTGGAAGNQRSQLIYDSGTAFGYPTWVFQQLSDTGTFVANALLVTRAGLLQLANQQAPIQPASMVTAITPNAGLTAIGCAYWKDACGKVNLEGSILNASGGSVGTIASTTPLPAGFRGNANMAAISTIGPVQVSVSAAGVITTAPALANGNQLFLDGLSFRATA